MRVSNSYYKTYAETVQNLKSQYNKSMNKVSSGQKYESGADNPSAYYQSEKLENLYNDVEAKDQILGDVLHRMEQQETSSRSLHTEMGNINTTLIKMSTVTEQGSEDIVDTAVTELKQRQDTMTQDLNLQYENYYVMGGNDADTVPFSSEFDNSGTFSITYHHKFAGEDEATHIKMTYNYDPNGTDGTDGTFSYSIVDANGTQIGDEDAALDKLITAMKEQGRMTLGYGTVRTGQRDTLPDTYFGGMNMITGMSSDQVRTLENIGITDSMTDDQKKAQLAKNEENLKTEIKKYMDKSAFGLNAKAVYSISNYQKELVATSADLSRPTDVKEARWTKMTNDLTDILGEWDNSMTRVMSTTRHIGVTYSSLQNVQSQLQTQQDTYQKEYDDKLGIDVADAITKMYSDQFAYNAALQVGSKIMQNSLFDFVQS